MIEEGRAPHIIIIYAHTPSLLPSLAEAEEEYVRKFANPLPAARRGFLDDVILPSTTRPRLIEELRLLSGKQLKNPAKKHGNIPL